MCLLGNLKSCRMNLQGQKLNTLGLAYDVSNLVGRGEHRHCTQEEEGTLIARGDIEPPAVEVTSTT